MRRLSSPRAVFAVVGFGVFIAADDLTVASTMLRQIIDDLHIALPEGFDDAAWIVNAYLIAYVAVMPFAGRLSDVWGRRRVFIGALSVFALGSAWLSVTTSLGPFLIARVLTAIGGGAMVPVALAVVGDLFTAERRGHGFGGLAAIDTLGWVWGPLFGALLVRFLDWRWQFYLNVPMALIGIALAFVSLRGVGKPSHRSLDLPGAFAMSVALIALTMGLLESAELATSADLAGLTAGGGPPAWPLFIVAAVAVGYLLIRHRRATNPLINPGSLRVRGVGFALGANLLSGAVLAVALVNVPLFVNLVLETETGRAALLSGWILTALTVSMAAGALLGGRLTDQRSARAPAITGLTIATLGLAAMGLTWGTGVETAAMSFHLAILGFGIGIATPALATVIVAASADDHSGEGASTVLVSRLVGIAVGLAGITAWALHRFSELRGGLNLPAITDPGYESAALAAQANLTGTVLGETFLAAASLAAVAVSLAALLPRTSYHRD